MSIIGRFTVGFLIPLSVSAYVSTVVTRTPIVAVNSSVVSSPYLPQTPTSWPCGIFHSPAPFPSEVMINNDWSCDVFGEHVQVFAGGLRHHPDQGVLFVVARSLDLHHVGGGRYYGPSSGGPLRIISYKGTVLKVESARGKVFFFSIHPGGYELH